MKAALCYAYAGAFALGAEKYFEVTDHYEDAKPYGEKTMRAYDPTRRIWPGPDWEPYEPVDAVFSNPPCAPFSAAGYAKGKGGDAWQTDARLSCHEATARFGADADAAFIVVESVQQSIRAKEFFESLQKRYLPHHKLSIVKHNAVHHGIPQDRRRVFWIYHTSKKFEPVEPEECRVLIPEDLNQPNAPMIRGLNDATKQILPRVPQGAQLRRYWDHPKGVTGVPSHSCKRLKWYSRTPAMAGVRGYVHPEEDRYITVPELLHLCGYPADYPFQGAPGATVLEACRAVLPPVAEWIAREVFEAL